MAISITVYPLLSPRVIMVDDPQTDITIQELVDAVREWEDSEEGQFYEYLIDAAGKESLGSGRYVGVTATLNNAKVCFEARVTPLDDGSGRTCDSTDSEGLQLYVNDADFVSDGVYSGCTVFNSTTGEAAVVTEVVDQYTLNHFELSGNGNQGWTSGDNYKVYENEPCSITGGNLVAVDSNGDPLDPLLQSTNVQVSRESSTSASLLEGSGGVTAQGVWEYILSGGTDQAQVIVQDILKKAKLAAFKL